jgi:hypothetical protein
MDLAGARVLLVADDRARLDGVHAYLLKAGARPQVTSRAAGLSAAAGRCEVAGLFDDYGEPDEFDACLATLRRSQASLVVITDRAGVAESAPHAGIVLAPTRLVRGWSLLDAIRVMVCAAAPTAVVDSTPELPFTD